MGSRLRTVTIALALATLMTGGCGGDSTAASGESSGESVTVYTSVTQDTVDAVVVGFEAANPGVDVEVFRAPTGELAARIAAEQRSGGLQADVLWLTDPLSIEQYSRDGLLRTWDPSDVEAVPNEYRTETYFGTRVLNLVIVAGSEVDPAPEDWDDLTTMEGGVAIPDPAFAGSAFAALGFFGLSPDYGMDFYRSLRDNGGVQVQAPGDVVTGVAEGIYAAGVTLDRIVSDAVDDGSPVVVVWPASGAIAMYSPIAVVDGSSSTAAEPFVEYVLGEEAQRAIAATGWEPIRSDVEWPERGEVRVVDWGQAFDRQDELLSQYDAIF